MRNIKICPDCSAEYFAHIDKCAHCDTALMMPEEVTIVQEERKQCMKKDLEGRVIVKEGDKKWIDELYDVLIDANVPCNISADAGCNKGCSADTRSLMVSKQDVEKAVGFIEEHYARTHPEIQASNEMASQGKCPACGSTVGSDAVECTDCGLTLLIVEE